MIGVTGFEHRRIGPRDPFPGLGRRQQGRVWHVFQPDPVAAWAGLGCLELGQRHSQRRHAIVRPQHPQAFAPALRRIRMRRFVELLWHIQALGEDDTFRPHLLGGALEVLVQHAL